MGKMVDIESPVIIAGIHGCGTSFMSSQLHRHGIEMWLPGNKTVHAEDRAILKYNEEFLGRCKFQWYSPTNTLFTWDWANATLIYRLKKYKQQRIDRGVIRWGFKAPRILSLWNLYTEVFDMSKAKIIICVRNPLAMVKSRRKALPEHARPTGLNKYGDDLKVAADIDLIHDAFFFNYDGDIRKQQASLSNYLSVNINLAEKWKYRK